MAARTNKQSLLHHLAELTTQIQTEDLELLERVAKCPSAKHASALLAGAIATALSQRGGDEPLLPMPAWIHPFI